MSGKLSGQLLRGTCSWLLGQVLGQVSGQSSRQIAVQMFRRAVKGSCN